MSRLVIGRPGPAWIVAELGINHGGDTATALRMVHAAADAGADAVKVQLFRAGDFCSAGAVYQGMSQAELFGAVELRDVRAVADEAHRCALDFFGTPATVEQGRQLADLGACAMKVGSDDLVHTPLIEGLSRLGLPLILSTGMADRQEINVALLAARRGLTPAVVLLHCVSRYPTPASAANLRRMAPMGQWADAVGYSDHTEGSLAAVLAVAMGARIIEKHFTLGRTLPGPDHAFSADPSEFALMVSRIRDAERYLGDGSFDLTDEEKAMRVTARRSIRAIHDLAAGHAITSADLCYLRPGDGLPPSAAQRLIGRATAHAIKRHDLIMQEDLCDYLSG